MSFAGAAHSPHGNGGAGPAVAIILRVRIALRLVLRSGRPTLFADIHNHILPGIDDGAISMANALHMARLAVHGGTDLLAATPHQSWERRKGAPVGWLRGLVLELQTVLDDKGVPLKIVPGLEIKMGPTVADDLTSGKLMTLGDAGRWALIEPPFDRIPPDALACIQSVRDAGFHVVLAHPERCRELQQDLSFVRACAERGVAFQLTTGSILGKFGVGALRTCETILGHASEWPLVIASDTHDLVDRAPSYMARARDLVAQVVGKEEAQRMVDTRPRAMLLPAP